MKFRTLLLALAVVFQVNFLAAQFHLNGAGVPVVHPSKTFDRWGGLVFESYQFKPGDFTAGWDGFFKSKKAHPGVYAWLAKVQFRDGHQQLLVGEVTLVR